MLSPPLPSCPSSFLFPCDVQDSCLYITHLHLPSFALSFLHPCSWISCPSLNSSCCSPSSSAKTLCLAFFFFPLISFTLALPLTLYHVIFYMDFYRDFKLGNKILNQNLKREVKNKITGFRHDIWFLEEYEEYREYWRFELMLELEFYRLINLFFERIALTDSPWCSLQLHTFTLFAFPSSYFKVPALFILDFQLDLIGLKVF